eukprot:TRINITY_DN4174_c0_g1_i1.p1 TRINITY_DN4174_c0_g1~~TRINITY_DN4174_c0_g1_i1.p1  ORF type:complete len:1046 (+),score=185.20 TRINITY_DN4174_c0_g1_i1:79-3216(+)
MTSIVRALTPPKSLFQSSLTRSQLEILQSLVRKHLVDPSLTDIANTEDFTATSTERGVQRYEHSHLIAALDVVLEYQRNRKATYFKVMGARAQTSGTYRHDPRTRLIELLKRWLRTHAANPQISEDEVRRMSSLCRDLLNYPNLFPSRNVHSFMQALSEVYEHLQLQLRQVLERDRTCADLAARCLSLSRNYISDAVAFLLQAPTDMLKTDKLPSLEVVVLWQSLPSDASPFPDRADIQLQKNMHDAWQTLLGSLIAALLGFRCTCRLFDGVSAEEDSQARALSGASPQSSGVRSDALALSGDAADAFPDLLGRVRAEFAAGNFKTSGLAGVFREKDQEGARQQLLTAVEAVFDLLYLLGEVLVQFHRISDSLGDYGMIRVASWLHPCLESTIQKVQQLRSSLEGLNKAVDAEFVLARARGKTLKKPCPTERMSARGHAAIERAVVGRECHAQVLQQALEELRAKSSPDRLPHVMEGLGDACSQLQKVLASPEFRARVGDAFPKLPPITQMGSADADCRPQLALADVSQAQVEDLSDPEDEDMVAGSNTQRRARHFKTLPPDVGKMRIQEKQDQEAETDAVMVAFDKHSGYPDSPKGCAAASSCFTLFSSESSGSGARKRSGSLPGVVRQATRSLFEALTGMGRPAAIEGGTANRGMPQDLVSELPAEMWVSHVTEGGREVWHNKTLGPAPWEKSSTLSSSQASQNMSLEKSATLSSSQTSDSRNHQSVDSFVGAASSNPFDEEATAAVIGAASSNPFDEDVAGAGNFSFSQADANSQGAAISDVPLGSTQSTVSFQPRAQNVSSRRCISPSAPRFGYEQQVRSSDARATLPLPARRASGYHSPGSSIARTPSPSPSRNTSPSPAPSVTPSFTQSPGTSTSISSAFLRKPPASPAPDASLPGSLRAEVYRLTAASKGWKRHDTRSLQLAGSQLLIYGKGSTNQVKTVVDIGRGEVERCTLMGDGILQLEVHRRKRATSLGRAAEFGRASSLGRLSARLRTGESPSKGGSTEPSKEQKLYFFEFSPKETAEEFVQAILSLRPGGGA